MSSISSATSTPSIAGRIPLLCWFIVSIEFSERFGYFGGSTPFQNYVQFPPQNGTERSLVAAGTLVLQPGALNKGQAVATALNNFYTCLAYLSPVLGAIVADQYLGKFNTILFSSLIYACGWLILGFTSIPSSYMEDGTPVFGAWAFAGFVASICIIGLGTGGIKSVVSPFAADQISKEQIDSVDENFEKHVKICPEKTVSRFYSLFYGSINIGSVSGQIICVFLEKRFFWPGFLLPGFITLMCVMIFLSKRKSYLDTKPDGSVLIKSFQCIRYALHQKNRMLRESRKATKSPSATTPSSPSNHHSFMNTPQKEDASIPLGFLRYAIPRMENDPATPWDMHFPEDVRRTLLACSIFPFLVIYWTCFASLINQISQAAQMKRPGWLSNDLVNVFEPLLVVLFIPIFDRLIYPTLTRCLPKFGYIARISFGLFIAGLYSLWAGLLQYWIYQTPPYFNHPLVDENGNPSVGTPNEISVWWQVPGYALLAISEIFAAASALEFAYQRSPESMKCVVSSLALFPNACASLIYVFLGPLCIDPIVFWVYTIVGLIGCATSFLFYFLFRSYDLEDASLSSSFPNEDRDGGYNHSFEPATMTGSWEKRSSLKQV